MTGQPGASTAGLLAARERLRGRNPRAAAPSESPARSPWSHARSHRGLRSSSAISSASERWLAKPSRSSCALQFLLELHAVGRVRACRTTPRRLRSPRRSVALASRWRHSPAPLSIRKLNSDGLPVVRGIRSGDGPPRARTPRGGAVELALGPARPWPPQSGSRSGSRRSPRTTTRSLEESARLGKWALWRLLVASRIEASSSVIRSPPTPRNLRVEQTADLGFVRARHRARRRLARRGALDDALGRSQDRQPARHAGSARARRAADHVAARVDPAGHDAGARAPTSAAWRSPPATSSSSSERTAAATSAAPSRPWSAGPRASSTATTSRRSCTRRTVP